MPLHLDKTNPMPDKMALPIVSISFLKLRKSKKLQNPEELSQKLHLIDECAYLSVKLWLSSR